MAIYIRAYSGNEVEKLAWQESKPLFYAEHLRRRLSWGFVFIQRIASKLSAGRATLCSLEQPTYQ